jgi:hypothetical protein
MSKNLIFAQKMTKLWACQISQNKKTPCIREHMLNGTFEFNHIARLITLKSDYIKVK